MPAYSVANRLVTLTFYRLALSDDVTQKDTKNDTKNDTKSKRTIRQQEIIKLVAENPTISIATLALRLKVSKPTIKREMFSLIGIGERAGSGIPSIISVRSDATGVVPTYKQSFAPDRVQFVIDVNGTTADKPLKSDVAVPLSGELSGRMLEKTTGKTTGNHGEKFTEKFTENT